MMNPKALEALRKARELFAEQKDDIPPNATPVEPLRKPKVHLIPTNAPKFNKETMKQEHKEQEQKDKYVEMSVTKAVESCLAKGIKKPADIAKETGKKVEQIYTALWKVKKEKRKAKLQAKPKLTPKQEADVINEMARVRAEWDREPTPFEDAHYVILHSREDYEQKIDALCMERNKLQDENAELKAVIKYLERKIANV